MTWWHPKPLRPEASNPLFALEEREPVVKGLTPWQRQRATDGTPHTIPGPTALRPPDPALYLRDELTKGSLVEKMAEKRTRPPETDPEDPMMVVKSYLAQTNKAHEDYVQKSQASTERMNTAIQALAKACGAEMEDKEDEEKSLTSQEQIKKPGQRAGAAVAGAIGGAARTVLGSVPKK